MGYLSVSPGNEPFSAPGMTDNGRIVGLVQYDECMPPALHQTLEQKQESQFSVEIFMGVLFFVLLVSFFFLRDVLRVDIKLTPSLSIVFGWDHEGHKEEIFFSFVLLVSFVVPSLTSRSGE